MKTKQLIFAALTALVVTACNDDNDSVGKSSAFPEDGVVRVDAEVNDVKTRAGVEDTNLTEIGFFFTTPGKDKYTYSNVKMTKQDGTWESDTEMRWADETTPVTVMGYAPFLAGNWLGTRLVTLSADQRTEAVLKASDQIYQQKTVNPATIGDDGLTSDGKIALSLHHILAKLQLKLTIGIDLLEVTPAVTIMSVKVNGMRLQYTIDYAAGGTVSVTGEDVISLLPFNAVSLNDKHQATYEAIIVPQAVEANVFFVEIVLSTNKTYVYTLGEAYTFDSNTCYTLPILVGTSTPQVSFFADKVTIDRWSPTEPWSVITD